MAEKQFTGLLTTAGSCLSSPMRIAWWRPGSCNGMTDSHSFSCAASSITRNCTGVIPSAKSLVELDAVQKIRRAFIKQNFSIPYLSVRSGSKIVSRSDLSKQRQSSLLMFNLPRQSKMLSTSAWSSRVCFNLALLKELSRY
ncbi:hypothetical protein A2U01_0042474, partial [Trifolium medium]|nr:hypothetical protein [Trifolium medium]